MDHHAHEDHTEAKPTHPKGLDKLFAKDNSVFIFDGTINSQNESTRTIYVAGQLAGFIEWYSSRISAHYVS